MLKLALARSLLLTLVVALLVSGCSRDRAPAPPVAAAPAVELPALPSAVEIPVAPDVVPVANPDLGADARRAYLQAVNSVPQEADHFGQIDGALSLNDAELARLAQNGFVLSERVGWSRFVEAYAWIYWKDLPVLVTTDSILHAVHQSYSDLLRDLEQGILIDQMNSLLRATRAQLAAAAAGAAPDLAPIYADVDDYLAVAIALLNGESGNPGRQADWVGLATTANRWEDVELFGERYPVDFTLFTPRGHYNTSEALQRYFRALSWLAHVDFRLVAYDPVTNEPKANLRALAAVAMLRDALDAAQQRPTWQAVNTLFEALVGRSDNMRLPDFDLLWADLGLGAPASALALPPERLLGQLSQQDYGSQRITGQIIGRHVGNAGDSPVPRPVSFMLLGQRFAIDSYVLGGVVYDRLIVDGEAVERALPSPLDAMYALGNDRAATHLAGELGQYPYAGTLAALRQSVDGFDPGFWTMPVYNGWLGMLRALNEPTLDERYPQAMRTAAWADKVLHTQLASWAQLRHDNLLYAKQSFTTAQIVCEYPAGYVEPYPAFYAALGRYAETGKSALAALDPALLPEQGRAIRNRALTYFGSVQVVAARLQALAEKELRQERFSAEEEAFLKSIVIRQAGANMAGCGPAGFEDMWDGWYMSLFYGRDDNPAVIADIHTNPNRDPGSSLYPPRVLHVATGPTSPLFLLVETASGNGLFVGPAFTYFEQITVGDQSTPAQRLDDEAWRERLASQNYPQAPAWTTTFRLPAAVPPTQLQLDSQAVPPADPWMPESPLPAPTAP